MYIRGKKETAVYRVLLLYTLGRFTKTFAHCFAFRATFASCNVFPHKFIFGGPQVAFERHVFGTRTIRIDI